jgi:anti-anti-sigma factor
MPISKHYRKSHLVVTITGELSGRFVTAIKEEFQHIHLEINDVLLLDVANMTAIDSSGIGLLVYIFKRIKPRNQHMILLGLKGQPKRIVKMAHIDRTIDCFDSLECFLAQQTTANCEDSL